MAPSTVQRLLRRVGLATRRARLTVLEQQAARTAGLLTARTRRALWRARHGRTRHVEATEPGELVCLDTFLHWQSQGRWQGLANHRFVRMTANVSLASTGRSRAARRRPLSVKGRSVLLVCCPVKLHAVSPCRIANTLTPIPWRG